jgi:hypothetical protein
MQGVEVGRSFVVGTGVGATEVYTVGCFGECECSDMHREQQSCGCSAAEEIPEISSGFQTALSVPTFQSEADEDRIALLLQEVTSENLFTALVALEEIDHFLQAQPMSAEGSHNLCTFMLVDLGGLQVLKSLEEHRNVIISSKASSILSAHCVECAETWESYFADV